jgi:flagellar basal body P-ring protein FlgI
MQGRRSFAGLRFLTLTAVVFILPVGFVHAERIKDLATLQGVRNHSVTRA